MFISCYTLYASMNAEYLWHPISFSRGPAYLGRRSKQHSGHIELRLPLSAIAFAIREWTEIDWELFSQVNHSLLHCHLISHTDSHRGQKRDLSGAHAVPPTNSFFSHVLNRILFWLARFLSCFMNQIHKYQAYLQ